MPEPREWFSARTRPEMLSSDDPPIRPERPAEILPGPGSLAHRAVRPFYRGFVRLGEAVPPLGSAAAVVPALRRRMGLEEPTGKQLVGVWATGAAGAAAVGLVVASVVVGAPAAVTQQFDRLAGLPGIGNEQPAQDKGSTDDTSGAAVVGDRAADPSRRTTTGGSATSGEVSAYRSDPYVGGYSGVPGVPGGAILPPGVGSASTEYTGGTVTRPVPGTAAPAPGGGTTAPAPGGSTTVPPPVQTTTPPVDTTTPPPPAETTPPPPPPAETTPPAPPAQTTPPAETTAPTTPPPAAETPAPTPAATSTTAGTPAPTPAPVDPTTPPPGP